MWHPLKRHTLYVSCVVYGDMQVCKAHGISASWLGMYEIMRVNVALINILWAWVPPQLKISKSAPATGIINTFTTQDAMLTSLESVWKHYRHPFHLLFSLSVFFHLSLSLSHHTLFILFTCVITLHCMCNTVKERWYLSNLWQKQTKTVQQIDTSNWTQTNWVKIIMRKDLETFTKLLLLLTL